MYPFQPLNRAVSHRKLLHTSLHKLHKQRMWVGNRTLELRVELYPNKERMGWDFNDFRQARLRIGARDPHARLFNLLFVCVVEFITMTVSLANQRFAIGLVGF